MRSIVNNWKLILGLMAWTMAGCWSAYAHGGEDHEHKASKAAPLSGKYYAAEALSERYEVLVKYGSMEPGKPVQMRLFLSDALTNLPVSGAKLQLSNPEDGKQTFEVAADEAGIYSVQTQYADGSQPATMQVKVDGALGADLIQLNGLVFGLEMQEDAATASNSPWLQWQTAAAVVVALILGLILGRFLRRRPKVARAGMAVLLLIVFSGRPFTNETMAHEGEDHGKEEQHNKAVAVQGGELTVPKETQFLLGVTTAKAGASKTSLLGEMSGTVVPTAVGAASVQTPQTGILRSLQVEVGAAVRKGQLLATIEQTVDAGTQVGWVTERNTLEAEVEAARKGLERLDAVRDIVAAKELEEAQRRYNAAKENLAAYLNLLGKSGGSKVITLTAPIDGQVERFSFAVGSTVSAGQELFRITNTSRVYVEAQAFPGDLAFAQDSVAFAVRSRGSSMESIAASIVARGQVVDASNQMQKLLLEVDNAGNKLRLGEYVTVELRGAAVEGEVAVPFGAVMDVDGQEVVFTKSAAERFRMVPVRMHGSIDQNILLHAGLAPGMKVVTEGAYSLKMMYQNP